MKKKNKKKLQRKLQKVIHDAILMYEFPLYTASSQLINQVVDTCYRYFNNPNKTVVTWTKTTLDMIKMGYNCNSYRSVNYYDNRFQQPQFLANSMPIPQSFKSTVPKPEAIEDEEDDQDTEEDITEQKDEIELKKDTFGMNPPEC